MNSVSAIDELQELVDRHIFAQAQRLERIALVHVAADKRLTKRANCVDDRRLDLGDLTQCLQRTQVVRNVLEQISWKKK